MPPGPDDEPPDSLRELVSAYGSIDPVANIFATLMMQKMRFRYAIPIDPELVTDMVALGPDKVNATMNYYTGDMLLMMDWNIPGNSWIDVEAHEEVKVPATWWQHFKSTVFPMFLIKRFPVKWRAIETLRVERTTHVCPHLRSIIPKSSFGASLHAYWTSTPPDDQDPVIKELSELAAKDNPEMMNLRDRWLKAKRKLEAEGK